MLLQTNKKVGKLKLFRIKSGMSQEDLAKASNVPVKCIGNYEQQRRSLNHARAITVYQLACALNCKVEDLLDLSDMNSTLS